MLSEEKVVQILKKHANALGFNYEPKLYESKETNDEKQMKELKEMKELEEWFKNNG